MGKSGRDFRIQAEWTLEPHNMEGQSSKKVLLRTFLQNKDIHQKFTGRPLTDSSPWRLQFAPVFGYGKAGSPLLKERVVIQR